MTDRHNPDCARNGCRACLGYGVIVDANGGPSYEACPGQADVRRRVAFHIARLSDELADAPWWHVRRRRHLRREGRRFMDRYDELTVR